MVTVKEIAEKANVSIGTVDRVIHNRGRVSEATRERVEQILQELDYKPNFFAKRLKLSKRFYFAVLMPQINQDNHFWELLMPGIKKAEKELEAYSIKAKLWHYDRNDEESFVEVSKKMMESNPDGLIIAPVVNYAVENFVKHICPTMPYVFVDSKIGSDRYLSFVGQNPFQSGTLAGKLMLMLVGQRKGEIAVFRSHLQEFHMSERSSGFARFIEKTPHLDIVYYDVKDIENPELYYELATECFATYPNLVGVFVTNVYTHGVARALKGIKDERNIHLIGYDLVPENIEYVKENVIDFLISLRPELQGYHAVMTLYNYLVLGNAVENKINVPIDILTKENLDFYKL